MQPIATLITCFAASWLALHFILTKGFNLFLQSDLQHPASDSNRAPQIGGLVVVPISLIAFAIANFTSGNTIVLSATNMIWPMIGLFLIGFYDDWKHIHPIARLVVQTTLVAFFITVQASTIALAPDSVAASIAIQAILCAIGVLFFIGSINAANFMDGIDLGLVANLLPGFVLLGTWLASGSSHDPIGTILLSFTGALLAFAIYNRPVAKIYLGDSGSLVLGFLMGLVGLYFLVFHQSIAGVLPFAYVYCDTFLTLLKRMKARENFLHSHSGHAYQNAKNKLSHLLVSLHIGIVSVFGSVMAIISLTWPTNITIQITAFLLSALAATVLYFYFSRMRSEFKDASV